MRIILNVIGILIFFFARLQGRDKSQKFSAGFWLKDNWEQLICVTLIDVALMLLVIGGGLEFNFEKLTWLPDGVQLAGDLALCFLVGLVFAWAGYVGYKKTFLDKKD